MQPDDAAPVEFDRRRGPRRGAALPIDQDRRQDDRRRRKPGIEALLGTVLDDGLPPDVELDADESERIIASETR